MALFNFPPGPQCGPQDGALVQFLAKDDQSDNQQPGLVPEKTGRPGGGGKSDDQAASGAHEPLGAGQVTRPAVGKYKPPGAQAEK